MPHKTFEEILKFNPYHDARGRFASANSATSFTYAPGKSKAHDKAIAGEKERQNTAGKGFKGTLYHGSPDENIEEFDIDRAGANTQSGEKLIFFTDSKQMAEDFSYERLESDSKFFQQRGKKGRVYEVDVEMKNPLDFRNLSDKDIDNIIKLDAEGLLTKELVQALSSNHQLLKASLNLSADSLKSLGYDGLIASTGRGGHNSLEYAVVDSKQAKIKKSAVAKTFGEVLKFNPYHDSKGRFAPANGAASSGKTTREAEIAELLGISADKVSLGNIPQKAKDDIYSGLKKTLDMFPELKGYTQSIEYNDQLPYVSLSHDLTGKIEVGPAFNDYEKLEQKIDLYAKKGTFPAGTTGESIIVHEMGHQLDGMLTKTGVYGAKEGDRPLSDTIRKTVLDKAGYSKTIQQRKKEYEAQGLKGELLDNAVRFEIGNWYSENISDRARMNAQEFFADCFSELVSSNKPREVATLFGKEIKKALEDERMKKSNAPEEITEKSFSVFKTDDDKRLVFGWASVSITVDGEQLEDRQKDMIDPEDLEEAAYEYVLNFRDTGEEHIPSLRKKGKLVESCVFTAEKQKAMGIPEGTLPIGWWIGFKITDDDAWERVKDGTYKMFSIEGRATREPVEKSVETVESVAKTFDEIMKFNPYHDSLGRFSTADASTSFTYKPGQGKMYDSAIAREKERTGGAVGAKIEDTPRTKALRAVEDRIRNQKFESAAIIDKDGNELLFKDGQKSQVGFNRAECNMMNGNTLTHNHPRCSMFSYEDLHCFTSQSMQEIRATNRDGVTYCMKRGQGYKQVDSNAFAQNYKKEYKKATAYAQSELDKQGMSDKIFRGEVSLSQANQEFGRVAAKYMVDYCTKNAANYGLEFSVEKVSVGTSKSAGVDIITEIDKAAKDIVILDKETDAMLDTAFAEWLKNHENQKGD